MRPLLAIPLLSLLAACADGGSGPDFDDDISFDDCEVAAENDFTLEYLDHTGKLWACPGELERAPGELVAERDGQVYYWIPEI